MNCGIISVVMDVILSIMRYFLSTARKHNNAKFEHNRPKPKCNAHETVTPKLLLMDSRYRDIAGSEG